MGIVFDVDSMIMESVNNIYQNMNNDNNDDILLDESGGMLTVRIFPLLLKRWILGKGYDYKSLSDHVTKIVGKCKTLDDIKYLRHDLAIAKGNISSLIENIENYQKDPKSSKLGRDIRKRVDKGSLDVNDVKKYLQFLKTDYPKLLDQRKKEIIEKKKKLS